MQSPGDTPTEPAHRSRRPASPRGPRFPPPGPPDDPVALSREAVELALRHGFVAAGVARAESPPSYRVFETWLRAGHHGDMAWLERDAGARGDPESILPHCRSILAVAREAPGGGSGNVARYARGADYHDVVRRQLKSVIEGLRPRCPPSTHFRVCVDTAPLLERDAALRAGLGFLGRSGLLIVPGVGSHVVLGELLTDVEMAPTATPPDATFDRCGSCTACLTSCPAQAFVAPALVDARRCLSYLSIEKRGPLSPDEEIALDGRLFGCDHCQDVCPWNAPVRPGAPAEPSASLDPRELVAIDEATFAARFAHTAIWRATAAGLRRNARAALARPRPSGAGR